MGVGGVESHYSVENCDMLSDVPSIYKYTIASSYASEDAVWAESLFDCRYDNITSYGCESWTHVGKVNILPCIEVLNDMDRL